MRYQGCFALLLACGLFTSCAKGQPAAAGESKDSTAENMVRDVLKDPESARFRDVQSTLAQGTILSCGRVNAKNAMGGYVGFTAYMVWQNQVRLEEGTDNPPEALRGCCLAALMAITEKKQIGAFPPAREWCTKLNTPFTF